MSIIDRVVLVAGASKGIGKAIALQAGKEAAYVIVNYNSDAQVPTRSLQRLGLVERWPSKRTSLNPQILTD